MPTPFTSVFHPTDLAAGSEVAFLHALKIAVEGRSRLTVAHVDAGEEPPSSWGDFPSIREWLTAWGLVEAGASRQQVVDGTGITPVKVRIRAADATGGLLHEATEADADLLVVSTHGRQGFARWLRPSVAEPVARGIAQPTLFLARDHEGFVGRDGTVRLRKALVPVAPENPPGRAMEVAAGLVRGLGHDPNFVFRSLYVGDDGDHPNVPREGFPVQRATVPAGNDVVDSIVETARVWDADLIVMATHGHDSWTDRLFGSTVERVVRQAPCPVLAVPG